MRIVTRPDFDGIVCAVLLKEAETITAPIFWVQPGNMQKDRVVIEKNDIIANLPYRENCAMWFDHHYSNRPQHAFKGEFRIAPSAAGIIFHYYEKQFSRDYSELVEMTDKIDSANLTLAEVNQPEEHPYILLSMTINGRNLEDEPYWNRLVDLLGKRDIENIMADTEVKRRCLRVIEDNRQYRQLLLSHTQLNGHVSITDFRAIQPAPDGNRFLVYALFPKAVVSVRIRYDDQYDQHLIVSVGHSIFNRNCHVNVGHMLGQFEGGGHPGAGSCTFHDSKADDFIPRIIDILVKNEPNE